MPESDNEFKNLRDDPEIAPYLEDGSSPEMEYDDTDQGGSNISARDVADKGVQGLLYKNAPKGSFLRKVQSYVRLARQKGFGFKKNPLQAIKDQSPEAKATRLDAQANRYQNFLKNNNLNTPEKAEEFIKTNGGDAKESLQRLHAKFGNNQDFYKPENFIEKPPVIEPGATPSAPGEAPPIIGEAPPIAGEVPPIITPEVVPPPIATPPVIQGATGLAETAASEGAAAAGEGAATTAGAAAGTAATETAATAGAAGAAAAGEGAAATAAATGAAGAATAAGTAAAGAGTAAGTAGAAAAGTAATAATTAAATAGATGAAAGTAAATAGTAAVVGGTIAAEAAVPVAGWIAAAATAVVAATVAIFKSKKAREIIGYILLGIALLIMIPIILFAVAAVGIFSPTNLATTASEKADVDTVSAAFGNQAALRKTVINDSDKLISSLEKTEAVADKTYSSDKAAAAKAAVVKIIAKIKTIKNMTDNATRAKTAEEVATAVSALNESYPEMMGFSKSCSGLSTYISSGQLTIKYAKDKASIVQGKLTNTDGVVVNASPNLCGTLSFLANKDYKIYISTLATGHTKYVKGTTRVSAHYYGRGADIAMINDRSVTKYPDTAREVMRVLYDNRAQLGIYQIYGPGFSWNTKVHGQNGAPTSDTIAGHYNHIHLSFKGAN